jgi:hypothetical protein
MLSQFRVLRKWRIAVAASFPHGLGESVLYGVLGEGAVTSDRCGGPAELESARATICA